MKWASALCPSFPYNTRDKSVRKYQRDQRGETNETNKSGGNDNKDDEDDMYHEFDYSMPSIPRLNNMKRNVINNINQQGNNPMRLRSQGASRMIDTDDTSYHTKNENANQENKHDYDVSDDSDGDDDGDNDDVSLPPSSRYRRPPSSALGGHLASGDVCGNVKIYDLSYCATDPATMSEGLMSSRLMKRNTKGTYGQYIKNNNKKYKKSTHYARTGGGKKQVIPPTPRQVEGLRYMTSASTGFVAAKDERFVGYPALRTALHPLVRNAMYDHDGSDEREDDEERNDSDKDDRSQMSDSDDDSDEGDTTTTKHREHGRSKGRRSGYDYSNLPTLGRSSGLNRGYGAGFNSQYGRSTGVYAQCPRRMERKAKIHMQANTSPSHHRYHQQQQQHQYSYYNNPPYSSPPSSSFPPGTEVGVYGTSGLPYNADACVRTFSDHASANRSVRALLHIPTCYEAVVADSYYLPSMNGTSNTSRRSNNDNTNNDNNDNDDDDVYLPLPVPRGSSVEDVIMRHRARERRPRTVYGSSLDCQQLEDDYQALQQAMQTSSNNNINSSSCTTNPSLVNDNINRSNSINEVTEALGLAALSCPSHNDTHNDDNINTLSNASPMNDEPLPLLPLGSPSLSRTSGSMFIPNFTRGITLPHHPISNLASSSSSASPSPTSTLSSLMSPQSHSNIPSYPDPHSPPPPPSATSTITATSSSTSTSLSSSSATISCPPLPYTPTDLSVACQSYQWSVSYIESSQTDDREGGNDDDNATHHQGHRRKYSLAMLEGMTRQNMIENRINEAKQHYSSNTADAPTTTSHRSSSSSSSSPTRPTVVTGPPAIVGAGDPCAGLLLSAGWDGQVYAYDLRCPTYALRLSAHSAGINAMCHIPSAANYEHLTHTSTSSSPSSLPSTRGSVGGSGSGSGSSVSLIATGSWDRTIKTWDLRALDNGPIHDIRGHVRHIAALGKYCHCC